MRKADLTRDEARERARLVSGLTYEVHIDLRGDETFATETVVRFACAAAGTSTFLEFVGEVESIELNGTAVDPSAHDGTRIRLSGLAEANELRVTSRGSYSRSGKGLNRFRDPVDGAVYVHSDLEPFDAHRVYPCFDQPDLKGTFRFSAVAPTDWEVVSNARAEAEPETEGDARRWRFRPTLSIPAYISVLVAGPFHTVRDRHRDIDLGLYCRRSLAEHLEPEEWLEVTRQGFDFFEDAFGYPYPFDKYDQVVVPEFAAGAMENAGCVTFHERYIFRSRVTNAAREMRAETLLHEMAHMWFGDLVTMRWWDDLWLNESFATYVSVLCEVEATRFRQAWTTFANQEKTWALQQDQLPTTHPIVADIPDVRSVHLNFDGITYAKGASVLKQLVAWVGMDRFLHGMKVYFSRHEFGNAELADFLAVLEEASGRDLRAWSKEWLETPGVNTLRAEFEQDGEAFRSFAIRQEAPEAWPTLRRHRVGVGLYDAEDGRLVRRERWEADVIGERSELGDLVGERVPDLVLVNDDDQTFTKIRFDDRSLSTVLERLGDIEDPLARTLCWTATWDMVRDAELPARDYLALVICHAAREQEIGVVERSLAQAANAINQYGDPANRATAKEELAAGALRRLESAEPGSDHQLAWARGFIGAARSPEHLGLLRGLLEGSVSFEGLAVDAELRWDIVTALAAAGVDDAAALIDAELERDPTDKGERYAAGARAARPDPEAKAEAWRSLLEDRSLSLAMHDETMRGFQQPGQEPLLEPYAGRYFDVLPEVWEDRDLEFTLHFGEVMYPRWIVDRRTVEMTEAYLGGEDVPGPIRRLLLEGKDRILRALRARATDRA
jgi:aminopeptidase N